jgi:hypothetical protein
MRSVQVGRPRVWRKSSGAPHTSCRKIHQPTPNLEHTRPDRPSAIVHFFSISGCMREKATEHRSRMQHKRTLQFQRAHYDCLRSVLHPCSHRRVLSLCDGVVLGWTTIMQAQTLNYDIRICSHKIRYRISCPRHALFTLVAILKRR